MSSISGHSKNVKPTPSTPPKPADLKSEDLELVAQRLSLIQGHFSQMPDICISGVRMMDGFLLVALKVNGHKLDIQNGSWLLDGKDVTEY